MQSHEIRKRFLDFFEKRGHTILPSASLVPQNDPSVLFNTAGMQPLVPYLLGEKHPGGTRLASCQKCVRTGDIEEVGNHKNLTFFEMLGNWSLGDYFKEEAISWSFEFLTSNEEGLGLDKNRLYVTVFEGDEDAPCDTEAVEIWKKYIPEDRIYFLPKKNNWWSPGENGPCGPDTEMFYDVTIDGLGDMTHEEYVVADEKGEVVEIWNDVFMQYLKKDGKVVAKLDQKNVDTGSGLERISMLMQGKNNVYETDFFKPAKDIIDFHVSTDHPNLFVVNSKEYVNSSRIILDHLRAAVFLISDGILPSNKDQGYVLRRLIRRSLVHVQKFYKKHPGGIVIPVVSHYILFYQNVYPEVTPNVYPVLKDEIDKFIKTLTIGLKEFEKGIDPFILATTYGFPIELTEELALERGMKIDRQRFDLEMKKHQELSRSGSEQKFKGGLANTNEKTVQLHTTHHLLLKALQEVLGTDVHQKGSNITEERLRIDFSYGAKMTDEQKKRVEDIVNEKIQADLKVKRLEMKREEAESLGAEMEFGAKYPDIVSIYVVENEDGSYFSKEFCGGPHVDHTGVLGTFKIQKEEAVAQGIRRIKGILI